MRYPLYDYQARVCEQGQALIDKGVRSMLLQLPTRAGKSLVATWFIERFLAEKKPVWFLCHTNVLINQMSEELTTHRIRHGIITPRHNTIKYRCQIISKDTLKNRAKKMRQSGWKDPELIIIDECVTGDTLINTNLGNVKIKDLDLKKHKTLLSFDGFGIIRSRIINKRETGLKNIIKITTESGKVIKCSENHLFYTESGWITAKKIKENPENVSVVVDSGHIKDQMADTEPMQKVVKDQQEEEVRKNGLKSLKISKKMHHFANVGAGSKLLLFVKPWMFILEMAITGILNTLKLIKLDRKNILMSLIVGKNQSSLVRCWEILLYYTHTEKLKTRDLSLIMENHKKNGVNIKPVNLKNCQLILQKGLILGTVKSGLEVALNACLVLKKFTTLCILRIKKTLLERFLIFLTLKVSHGGIVMMDTIIKIQEILSFVQKDSRIQNKRLLKLIFKINTENALFTRMESEGIDISDSLFPQLKICKKKYQNTFQNQCNIRLEKILKVETLKDKEICYDLEVEKTHCYFTNGILSHNCHLAKGKVYIDLIKQYPNAILIGLTATPIRLDGKGLDDLFQELVIGPSIKELQQKQRLCNIVTYQTKFDTSGMHSRGGDFNIDEVLERVDKPKVLKDIVRHWEKLAMGKKTLTFCASISHAQHMAEEFNNAGYPSVAVSSEDPADVIAQKVQAYYSGKYINLVSVSLFIMGFTVKDCECIIQTRPTQSLMIYLQTVGRGMVYLPNKTLINLDCVNNVERHGLPEADRQWSLIGKPQKAKEEKSELKRCIACLQPTPKKDAACINCGFEFEQLRINTGRSLTPEERDGELIKVG